MGNLKIVKFHNERVHFSSLYRKESRLFPSGFHSEHDIDIYCTKIRQIVDFSAKTIAFIKKMLYYNSEGPGVIRSVNDVI